MSRTDDLNDALDALSSDRSPRDGASRLAKDELAMLRMAQFIRGTCSPAPDPAFVARLQQRLHQSLSGMSRRTVLFASMGTLAAGIIAGLGLNREFLARISTASRARQQTLLTSGGRWFKVASLDDVPSGSVRSFTAGAVQGVLVHDGGTIRALSRICTHMGCALDFDEEERTLVCPCHGAEFDLEGTPEEGPRYPPNLRPLARIEVRIRDDGIEVRGA